MSYRLSKRSMVLLATCVYLLAVSIVYSLFAHKTNSLLVYALDDTYIHMSISKNLALHGQFGVSPFEFSSSSSSIVWPFLLAATYKLLGVNDLTPFLIQIFLGIALIVFLARLLVQIPVPHSRWIDLAFVVAVIFIGPLPTVTFQGLEHLAHGLVNLAFVYCAVRILALKSPRRPKSSEVAAMLLFSALATALRYEAGFVVLVVSCLFLCRGRSIIALRAAAAGLFPMVVFGTYSFWNNSFILPNSVLLKGGEYSNVIEEVIKFFTTRHLFASRSLLTLMILSATFYVVELRKSKDWRSESQLYQIVFLCCSILHLQFASVQQFYRYEFYLVVLGIFAVARATIGHLMALPGSWRQMSRAQVLALVLLIVSSIPLLGRSWNALNPLPGCSYGIFEQQYQMGQFLKRHYQNAGVVANDIGAITYLSDIHLTDLMGLGTLEVCRMLRQGTQNASKLHRIAIERKAKIAVVYASLVKKVYGEVPPEWTKVAEWNYGPRVIGDVKVSFFAVDPSEVTRLRRVLELYERSLPQTVQVGYEDRGRFPNHHRFRPSGRERGELGTLLEHRR